MKDLIDDLNDLELSYNYSILRRDMFDNNKVVENYLINKENNF